MAMIPGLAEHLTNSEHCNSDGRSRGDLDGLESYWSMRLSLSHPHHFGHVPYFTFARLVERDPSIPHDSIQLVSWMLNSMGAVGENYFKSTYFKEVFFDDDSADNMLFATSYKKSTRKLDRKDKKTVEKNTGLRLSKTDLISHIVYYETKNSQYKVSNIQDKSEIEAMLNEGEITYRSDFKGHLSKDARTVLYRLHPMYAIRGASIPVFEKTRFEKVAPVLLVFNAKGKRMSNIEGKVNVGPQKIPYTLHAVLWETMSRKSKYCIMLPARSQTTQKRGQTRQVTRYLTFDGREMKNPDVSSKHSKPLIFLYTANIFFDKHERRKHYAPSKLPDPRSGSESEESEAYEHDAILQALQVLMLMPQTVVADAETKAISNDLVKEKDTLAKAEETGCESDFSTDESGSDWTPMYRKAPKETPMLKEGVKTTTVKRQSDFKWPKVTIARRELQATGQAKRFKIIHEDTQTLKVISAQDASNLQGWMERRPVRNNTREERIFFTLPKIVIFKVSLKTAYQEGLNVRVSSDHRHHNYQQCRLYLLAIIGEKGNFYCDGKIWKNALNDKPAKCTSQPAHYLIYGTLRNNSDTLAQVKLAISALTQ